jgi:uncharacterized membrane protein
MTPILDPVWPWSYLWEVLLQIPAAMRIVAAVAALASLVVGLVYMARGKRPLLAGLGLFGGPRTQTGLTTSSVLFTTSATALGLALLLLAHHTWPVALSISRGLIGSGFSAYLLALALQIGLALLLLGPPLLVGLGTGTYFGTPGITHVRLGTIVGLRLLAFLLTILALARPALAWAEREKTLSQLFFLLDRSRSLTVQDERGQMARWELLQRSLRQAEPAIARLRDEQQVDVKFFGFADDFQEISLDALGEPIGKRTDVGGSLRQLFDRRDTRLIPLGVLLLSDGADNGGVPAIAEAMRWRGIGCPLHTFALGNPGTTPRQNDVAIISISTSPSPFVPIKGKLTVKLVVDARGFENSKARARLFLEGPDGKDNEVTARDITLPLTTGNEVTLETDAPAVPGEIKLKAVVETPEPDNLPLNNTIETFVTISKEGISVLLVDRQRAHEPQFLCDALAVDPRIRITPVWVRGGKPTASSSRLLDEQPFDVILLGDVTADQLRSIDADAPAKIEKQVARGAGLMVLGGYVNLGNGGWEKTELARLLPVALSPSEQIDKPVRMYPTDDGKRVASYILRLDDNPDLKQVWDKLARLDGMTALKLPEPRGLQTVLATTEKDGKGEPILIMQPYGGKKGTKTDLAASRVLVFGGDTTYRWVRDEEGQKLHERFWRQMIVWLARQEDTEGSVWVRPDVRRLPVRGELGFAMGMRGKGGGPDLRVGKYDVEMITPDGAKVSLMRGTTQTRGVFATAKLPGIYKVSVKGEGKDPAGGVVTGTASARVIVYDEDLELARPAADPEFLRKLASAGSGEALRIEQLGDFLNRLAEQPLERGKPRMELRPDWRTTSRSSFFVGFFVLFTAVVCVEWGLRRRWGLV